MVPHPDELALDEVTNPDWTEPEDDELLFRQGCATYPALPREDKRSRQSQQLLSQVQESLQEPRRWCGLGKLPEKSTVDLRAQGGLFRLGSRTTQPRLLLAPLF